MFPFTVFFLDFVVTSSLHVVGSKTLGGAERFCLRLLEGLRESGDEVGLVHRRGSEVADAVPPSIATHPSPLRTVWDPLSRRDIAGLIRRLRPDIVQTYMGRATRQTRLSRRKGPVHVARLGGYYKLNGYFHAHAWIGNTRGVCDYMLEAGLPVARVHHISNFIDEPAPVSDADLDALRGELGIPEDALTLMTAGRFVPVKGHCHLLEAFARLPDEIGGRPLWLVMVGDGPLQGGLGDQARQLGLENRVAWAGWRTEPGPFFQLADLVVFPSLEMETLGNVILEAWAHRRPLVTTRFRGARELTHHGEDAWQAPCADSEALAEAIRRVLTDPELGRDMAARGRGRIDQEFTRQVIVGQYRELYQQLLAGR